MNGEQFNHWSVKNLHQKRFTIREICPLREQYGHVHLALERGRAAAQQFLIPSPMLVFDEVEHKSFLHLS